MSANISGPWSTLHVAAHAGLLANVAGIGMHVELLEVHGTACWRKCGMLHSHATIMMDSAGSCH
jgi:uncharacterized protein YwlG (UPF0340 family)